VGGDVSSTPIVVVVVDVVVVVVVLSSPSFDGADVIGAFDGDNVIGAAEGFLLGDLDVGEFVREGALVGRGVGPLVGILEPFARHLLCSNQGNLQQSSRESYKLICHFECFPSATHVPRSMFCNNGVEFVRANER
jgi:hypothetical protein